MIWIYEGTVLVLSPVETKLKLGRISGVKRVLKDLCCFIGIEQQQLGNRSWVTSCRTRKVFSSQGAIVQIKPWTARGLSFSLVLRCQHNDFHYYFSVTGVLNFPQQQKVPESPLGIERGIAHTASEIINHSANLTLNISSFKQSLFTSVNNRTARKQSSLQDTGSIF